MAADRTLFRRRAYRRQGERLAEKLGAEAPRQLREIAYLSQGELESRSPEELEKTFAELIAGLGAR